MVLDCSRGSVPERGALQILHIYLGVRISSAVTILMESALSHLREDFGHGVNPGLHVLPCYGDHLQVKALRGHMEIRLGRILCQKIG